MKCMICGKETKRIIDKNKKLIAICYGCYINNSIIPKIQVQKEEPKQDFVDVVRIKKPIIKPQIKRIKTTKNYTEYQKNYQIEYRAKIKEDKILAQVEKDYGMSFADSLVFLS